MDFKGGYNLLILNHATGHCIQFIHLAMHIAVMILVKLAEYKWVS